MNIPNFILPKPISKDYPTFEEYEMAVEIWEEMQIKNEQIQKIKAVAKNDEELEAGLKSIGITKMKAEDIFGEEGSELMILMDIQFFEDTCNESFFYGLLAEKDRILPKNFIESEMNIPKSWSDKKAMQGNILKFCLDLLNALIGEEILKKSWEKSITKKEFQYFGQNLYFFCQKVLWLEALNKKTLTKKFPQKEADKITEFLSNRAFIKVGKTKIFREFIKEKS